MTIVVAADDALVISGGVHLKGLSVIVSTAAIDDRLKAAVNQLQRSEAVVGLEVPLTELSSISPGELPAVAVVMVDARSADVLGDRGRYLLRTFATGVRAAHADMRLAIALVPGQLMDPAIDGLGAYFDIVSLTADADAAGHSATLAGLEIWTEMTASAATVAEVVTAPRLPGSDRAVARIGGGRARQAARIAELQTVLPAGLTPMSDVTVSCDAACDANVYLHPHTLDAIAVVRPQAPVARITVAPTALDVSVYGDADTRGSGPQLDLPSLTAPFIVRIHGWRGSTEDVFASDVQVIAARRLRVDEIIARHQAARARQTALVRTDIATGSTALVFQVPGFAAPFTITAKTRVFAHGRETIVEQRQVQVNGLDLERRAGEVPRLPLIEPERVNTPPLTIALTESYRYALQGHERINGHDAYVVSFTPNISNRSLFAGRAWIDSETFGVIRTDATQTALHGPIASSRQIDDFEPSGAGRAPLWLPRRSETFQVYVGPSESTPIHRVVSFDGHDVNTPDYELRLDAALRSNAVMLRDTPQGYRFLIPNKPGSAGEARRLSPSTVEKIVAAVVGSIFDPNISVPLVFAGVSYVDFNLFKTGAQLNAFFGGTYGRFSWSTPPIRGGMWRLAGDGAGVAISYNDRLFRDGVEHYGENIRQRPGQLSVALLGTIAPAVRLRATYDLGYTRYAAATTTVPAFVVPANTPVHGARVAIEAESGAWSAVGWFSVSRRQTWTPWGLTPSDAQRDARRFERVGGTIARSMVWTPRAVGRVEAAFMSGRRLDRFSRFAFGSFDNPLRGYPSVSVRYDDGMVVRSAATWTPAPHLRVDGFGDIGVVWQPDEPRARSYPGFGAAIEIPAPFGWLVAVEWGYGVRGVNADGTRGTHVVRASGYKVF